MWKLKGNLAKGEKQTRLKAWKLCVGFYSFEAKRPKVGGRAPRMQEPAKGWKASFFFVFFLLKWLDLCIKATKSLLEGFSKSLQFLFNYTPWDFLYKNTATLPAFPPDCITVLKIIYCQIRKHFFAEKKPNTQSCRLHPFLPSS